MDPEAILRLDTAPSAADFATDEWDEENCCNYSADGVKLLDAENFPDEVTVRPGCRVVCDGAFAYQPYMAQDYPLGAEVPVDEQVSFLDGIRLPEGLTHIGREAFLSCAYLKGIRLPKGLLVIGDRAFKDCWQLRRVSCPATLLSIGERAFEDCFSLYHIRLNKGLRFIGARAFDHCGELGEIRLPAGLERVGKEAFRGCDALEAIRVPKGSLPRFKTLLPKSLHRLLEEE